MSNLRILALSMLLASAAFGQKLPKNMMVTETVIGSMVEDQRPILVKQFESPYNIVYDRSGVTQGRLIVVFRKFKGDPYARKAYSYINSGYLTSIDLTRDTIEWSKEIGYFDIRCTDDMVLYTNSESTRGFDRLTGAKLWEKNLGKIQLLDKDNIALTPYVSGLDMVSATKLWSREVDGKYGWNYLDYMNDSTLLLSAGGLHQINTRDGSGWSYKARTGEEDVTGTIVSGIIGGVMLGAVGVAVLPASNVTYGIVSDPIIDSLTDNIYYSSGDGIVCLDRNGKTRWKHEAERKEVSSADLFLLEDRLYVINKGSAYFRGAVKSEGAPYFASYDKTTGKLHYKRKMPEDNKVKGVDHKADELIIYAPPAAYKYRLSTGELLLTAEPEDKWKANRGIAERKYLYPEHSDSMMRSLAEREDRSYYLARVDGGLSRLNEQLVQDSVISSDRIWTEWKTYGPYKLLVNKDRIKIIQDGRSVAHLNLHGRITLSEHWLIHIESTKLQVLDLRSILPQ